MNKCRASRMGFPAAFGTDIFVGEMHPYFEAIIFALQRANIGLEHLKKTAGVNRACLFWNHGRPIKRIIIGVCIVMTIDRIACVVTQALNCHNFRNLRMWWKYPHQPSSIKTYPHRNDLTSRRRCAWNAWVLTIRLLGFSPQNSKCENIWNQFYDLSNTYSKTHVYYTQASKTLCRAPKNTYTKHVVFPLSLFLCGVCVKNYIFWCWFIMLSLNIIIRPNTHTFTFNYAVYARIKT